MLVVNIIYIIEFVYLYMYIYYMYKYTYVHSHAKNGEVLELMSLRKKKDLENFFYEKASTMTLV